MIINFSVNNQELTSDNDLKLVERSTNYLKCHFTFNDDWNGLERLALFLPVNETIPIPSIIDDNGDCDIPAKIAYYGGQCKLAVIGSNTDIISENNEANFDNVIITTNSYRLHFDTTIRCDAMGEDEDPENPFFITLRQNTEAIKRLEKEITSLKENENGVTKSYVDDSIRSAILDSWEVGV